MHHVTISKVVLIRDLQVDIDDILLIADTNPPPDCSASLRGGTFNYSNSSTARFSCTYVITFHVINSVSVFP